MGTYATTTTLDILTVGFTFDTATTAIADQCITWAEDEINKKLSKRYDISNFLASVPPLVQSLTEQMSLGFFYDQESRGGNESQTRADRYFKRVKDNLNMLVNGELDIVDSAGSIIARRSGVKGVLSNTSDYTQTFAEDSELNWAVDSDKVSDIQDSRD